MAEPEKEPAAASAGAEEKPSDRATPKKATRKAKKRTEDESEEAPPRAKRTPTEEKKAPRRPSLDPETTRLLGVRDRLSSARPLFVRQAAHRYHRIGRWENWRRPRGLQSKQRRHYGYRSRIVRIGYGSPTATRGLTPSGFRPVLVRTPAEIEALDIARDAAVIARTVGTRRRLVLEEAARKRGLKVLNPLVKDRGEA